MDPHDIDLPLRFSFNSVCVFALRPVNFETDGLVRMDIGIESPSWLVPLRHTSNAPLRRYDGCERHTIAFVKKQQPHQKRVAKKREKIYDYNCIYIFCMYIELYNWIPNCYYLCYDTVNGYRLMPYRLLYCQLVIVYDTRFHPYLLFERDIVSRFEYRLH